mgnify:CR=1 FL=1
MQGWDWGEPRPKTITFFIGCGGECCSRAGETCPHHGSAKVCDQHGRPIRGAVVNNKEVVFATATHAQVIDALTAERIDWQKLTSAGWPQLPYEQLRQLKSLPPTPEEELLKIFDPRLRRDAIRAKRECLAVRAKEVEAILEAEEQMLGAPVKKTS